MKSGVGTAFALKALAKSRRGTPQKRGERPGGAGRSGLRGVAWKEVSGRSYRGPLERPVKLKKRTTTHTEMQTAKIIGIPPGFCQLQPRDHSAIRARPRLWNESHIQIGTLVLPTELLHTQVGDVFERVVEAVGEIGHANRERQIDDLSFVVELVQFFEFGGANCGRGAGHAVSIEDRRFFFLIK